VAVTTNVTHYLILGRLAPSVPAHPSDRLARRDGEGRQVETKTMAVAGVGGQISSTGPAPAPPPPPASGRARRGPGPVPASGPGPVAPGRRRMAGPCPASAPLQLLTALLLAGRLHSRWVRRSSRPDHPARSPPAGQPGLPDLYWNTTNSM
jgi:hypothetical protein